MRVARAPKRPSGRKAQGSEGHGGRGRVWARRYGARPHARGVAERGQVIVSSAPCHASLGQWHGIAGSKVEGRIGFVAATHDATRTGKRAWREMAMPRGARPISWRSGGRAPVRLVVVGRARAQNPYARCMAWGHVMGPKAAWHLALAQIREPLVQLGIDPTPEPWLA